METIRSDRLLAKRNKLYEGKAKIIYDGPEPGTIVQYFKDDAVALNGTKKDIVAGKGVLNNRISSHIMTRLEGVGIPTHFLHSMNMREQLTRKLEMIPVEIVVRNIVAGSLSKRLGLEEGKYLPKPLVEFYYKDDALGNPLISEDHILTFGWADPYEMEEIVAMSLRVNDYLSGLFTGIGLKLVDFKLEFGRLWGEYDELYIILADEITPDTCRIWDAQTGEKLDKDRFLYDLGDLVEGYQEIAKRLGLIPEGGLMKEGEINEDVAAQLEDIENERARERKFKAVKTAKKPQKS